MTNATNATDAMPEDGGRRRLLQDMEMVMDMDNMTNATNATDAMPEDGGRRRLFK